MFGVETLTGPGKAAALVALVLVEAILLYVGYGALTAAVGERLTETLRGK